MCCPCNNNCRKFTLRTSISMICTCFILSLDHNLKNIECPAHNRESVFVELNIVFFYLKSKASTVS